jgi:hypothetical protein
MITPLDLAAVVAPAGALGGAGVLAANERGVPVISVDNPCVLQVTADALDLERSGAMVLRARSYSEAAGLLLALREGISPASLQRPLVPLA